MTNHTTVYIANMIQAHDYSPAALFGAIRPITIGNRSIFQTSELIQDITSAIANSGPDDYIMLAGSVFISALCLTAWLEQNGQAKVLLWDNKTNAYVVRVIARATLRKEIETTRDRIKDSRMVR